MKKKQYIIPTQRIVTLNMKSKMLAGSEKSFTLQGEKYSGTFGAREDNFDDDFE